MGWVAFSCDQRYSFFPANQINDTTKLLDVKSAAHPSVP